MFYVIGLLILITIVFLIFMMYQLHREKRFYEGQIELIEKEYEKNVELIQILSSELRETIETSNERYIKFLKS